MKITIQVFDDKDVKKAMREVSVILKEMTEHNGKIIEFSQNIDEVKGDILNTIGHLTIRND